MAWRRKIRFSGGPPFGKSANLYSAFKKKGQTPELVIICINNGGGWRPVKCLLPGQFYEEDLAELQKQIGSAYHGEICAFPVKSDSYVTISKQEWGK